MIRATKMILSKVQIARMACLATIGHIDPSQGGLLSVLLNLMMSQYY